MTMMPLSAANAADRSSDGSAWHSEPPTVPHCRTIGSGMTTSASRKTALRQDLGDQLVTRSQSGMTLTPGGSRLLGTASQIVVLGAEAHAAVRAAQGAPEQLRVIATATFAEFVAAPLMEAFSRRFAGA